MPVPNPSLYADGCRWDPDPNSPNYLSCLAAGKAGGLIVTTYEIDIIAGGGDSVGLLALIYDLSGGSYHYNTDFSKSPGDIIVGDPTVASFAKRFVPSSIGADGTAVLRFTITNPNPFAVSGYRFLDDLPGNMEVADPANASSTCGGTLIAVPGSGEIDFEGGAIAANSSCTILVSVTVPLDPLATYPVELDNVADLFVDDAEDPSDTAEATLIVTEDEPPPLECVDIAPGTLVAEWSQFLAANNPNHPSTGPAVNNLGIGTAAGVGNTTSAPGPNNRWVGNILSDAAEPNLAARLAAARNLGRYYEFVLDTTGLDAVNLSFQVSRQNANAPSTITLDYGPAGDFSLGAQTWGPVSTTAGTPSTFAASNLTNLAQNGNTLFRLYIYDAANPNIDIRIHNASFTGEGEICTPIDPEDAPESPILSKSFDPNPVFPGQVSTLTFVIENPNPGDALSGITFRDELPAGMVSVGGFVNSGCGGTWGLEAGDPAILLLTGGTLGANATCSLSVDVASSSVGNNVNISDPVDATETLPGNSAIDSLEVLPPPLPASIAKFFDPNPLLDPDGATTLIFQVTNNDPSLTISSVAFSDVLPSLGVVQMQPVTPFDFDDNGLCGPAFTFTWDGLDTLSFSNGEIAAGETCQIEVEVEVPGLDPLDDLPAIFPNQTSAVSHVFEGITYLGNQANATLLVDQPIPGIELLKQVGPSDDPDGVWSNYLAVPLNGTVYYKLTVENIGETVLTDVVVSDPDVDTSACPWELDPDFELPIADVSDPEAHIAVCIIGPVLADEAGVFPNFASATAMSGDDEVSDTDSAIYATSEITLVKTADPLSFVGAGDVISYTFAVTNAGSAILQGPVEINDPLITDVVCPPLTTIGNEDNFFDPGEVLICTGSYTIESADVVAGFVTNVAFAFTPEAVSEIDDATVTLLTPSVSVVKSADPATGETVIPGQTLTYTLTVTVSDAATTDDVVLTDTLGAGLTVGTLPPGCGAAGQVVTCTLASGAVPDTYTFVYTATVDADATVAVGNSVVIDEGGGDPDPACPDCETEHPVTDSSVSVNKSADPVSGTAVTAGQTISYTLSVEVSDSATTDDVVLTDTLGAGLTVGTLPPECSAVGQVVTCTLLAGSVPATYTFVYTATVDADATTSVSNSVEASGGDDPACGTCTTLHPLSDRAPIPVNSLSPIGILMLVMLLLMAGVRFSPGRRPI